MMRSIESVKVKGRKVILRAGLDVPLVKNVHTEKWQVDDDSRLKDLLPTLGHLIKEGAKIVIIGHLGRPEGWDEKKSLKPVADKLGELLNCKVLEVTKELPSYPIKHLYNVAPFAQGRP